MMAPQNHHLETLAKVADAPAVFCFEVPHTRSKEPVLVKQSHKDIPIASLVELAKMGLVAQKVTSNGPRDEPDMVIAFPITAYGRSLLVNKKRRPPPRNRTRLPTEEEMLRESRRKD